MSSQSVLSKFAGPLRKLAAVGVTGAGFWGFKEAMAMDPQLNNSLSAQMIKLDEHLSSAFQRYRKERLYSQLSGEVVQVNAGSGFILKFFPDTVTKVVANEPNPVLSETFSESAHAARLPDHIIRTADAVTFLSEIAKSSVDNVVLDSALQRVSSSEAEEVLKQCHRILKPGGKLLFAEPMVYPSILHSFNALRASLRNLFFSQYPHCTAPALCTTFDRVYLEDWSRPSHMTDSHQVRPLISSATQLPEARIAEFQENLLLLSPSVLFRNVAAGFAVKSGLMEGSQDAMFARLVTMNAGRSGSLTSATRAVDQEQAELAAAAQWDQQYMHQKRVDHMKWRRRDITMHSTGFQEDKPLD